MKEHVDIELNGETITIGYSAMMAPSALREKNRVFKMLRLNSKIKGEEGDIFFFEFDNDEWVLLHEFSFLNLEGPKELQNVYEKLSHSSRISWEEFIELVYRNYYWEEKIPAN